MATKPKTKAPARKPAAKKSDPKPAAKPKPAPKSKPAASPKRKAKDPAPPKPKPAVDFNSPEYLAAYDAETAKRAGEKAQEVYRLKAEWEDAHELAAGLKKEFESHRTELLAYHRERIDKRGKNPGHLFAEAEAKETIAAHQANGKAKKKGKGAELPDAPPAVGKAEDWYPENLWQQYPLGRLKGYGLTDADLKALDDCTVTKAKGETFAPIDTLGAMTRFQEPKGNGFCWRITDVKGIGPAAAERIANAITAFWADWPNLQVPFAVEKGYNRPDPLAEEAPADEVTRGTGKKRRGKRGSSGGEPGPADGGERLSNTLTTAEPSDEPTADPAEAAADLGGILPDLPDGTGEDAAADLAFDADREAAAK